MIGVVDVGLGNLRSVVRALERAAGGQTVGLVTTPEGVARASALVFPGQGSFGSAADLLASSLGEALRGAIVKGRPYLGICLGLQLLFEASEEAPGKIGMGIFRGQVKRLSALDSHGRRLKIPRMGWSEVAWTRPLLAAQSAALDWFYFTHSYHAVPADDKIIAGKTEHGGMPIVASVTQGNITAVQFHPEKSQATGLAFLRTFLEAPCK